MGKKKLMVVFSLFLPLLMACSVYASGIAFTADAAGLHLTWDPPISLATITGYRVFHRVEGESYDYKKAIADVDSQTLECLIPGLVSGETYYFVARAYNDYYESVNSNEFKYQVPDSTSTTTIPTLNRPAGLIVVRNKSLLTGPLN